jgi:hypothetical protein
MSLTVNQLVMLNHEAHIQQVNTDRRVKAQSDKDKNNTDSTPGPSWRDNPAVGPNGERLSELEKPENDDKLFNYLRDWKDMG